MDLWKHLNSELKAHLEAHSKILEFKRGENVYLSGDQPKGLYSVQKGLVGLLAVGQNSGKEYLLRFFRQGDFFGHRSLFSDEPYHGSSVALEPTSVSWVPKKLVLDLFEKKPELMKDVVLALSRELKHCELQHVMILENEVISRVAQSVIYLKEINPEHNWTRQEIANFCASTVSTVIKALSELEDLGYIKQEGRVLTILNKEALLSLQDFN